MDEKERRPSDRQDDVIWIQMNQDYLWEHFAGKWIAVYEQELVGVGDTLSEALDEANASGYDRPLVSGVRKREYQGVKMIRPAWQR